VLKKFHEKKYAYNYNYARSKYASHLHSNIKRKSSTYRLRAVHHAKWVHAPPPDN